jgi:hypothetical protein
MLTRSSRSAIASSILFILLLALLTPLTLLAQTSPSVYSGKIMGHTIAELETWGAASFSMRGFDGHDERTFPVIYCKEARCPDALNGVLGTNLSIQTEIGVRSIFGDKMVQVTGEWIGGDFYAHQILHTSTGVIRQGSIDGFGGLRYFSYDIQEGSNTRRVSPVICDTTACGGYTNKGLTDKQTDDIKAGKEITATGYEAVCIPVDGAPFDVCTQIGTATKISNPIMRGTGTIRQIDPLGAGAVSYVIDRQEGGTDTVYVCETRSCYQNLEDTLWSFYKTDFRQSTHLDGQPKPGDLIRYYGEKLGDVESYLHDVEILEAASCDEQEKAYDDAKAALKSAENTEKAAGKRLTSATKRVERRIRTILKIQKIRLKRKEERKNKLEKAVERLQTQCDNGNNRSCRKLDRKKKNLADIIAKIEAKKAKDAEKIASLEAGLVDLQRAYDDAVAAVDTAVKTLEDAEAAMNACSG